jgi:hypothetical protein
MSYTKMHQCFAYARAGQLQQFTHISVQLSCRHSSALHHSGFSHTLSLSLQCKKFHMRLRELLTTVLGYLQWRAQNSKWGVKCYCNTPKFLQPMLQSVTYFWFCLLRDPKMESDQNVSVAGRAGWGDTPTG